MTAGRERSAEAILGSIAASCEANRGHADRLWKWLGHLDAGRALVYVTCVVAGARRLRTSLAALAPGTEEVRAGLADLVASCDELVRSLGAGDGAAGLPLPHIGWGTVVDSSGFGQRYGFTSNGSIETFAELLRHLSRACEGMAGLESSRLDLVERVARASPPLRERCRAASSALHEERQERAGIQRVLDRAAHVVGEVIGQSREFDERRKRLQQRASREDDREVAALLRAVGGVRSRHAWIPRKPGSRLTACEVIGAYRLRLSFADGTVAEVELAEAFWSVSGHDVDADQFSAVRLDTEQNLLCWPNGVREPGERLHLAIEEGRL